MKDNSQIKAITLLLSVLILGIILIFFLSQREKQQEPIQPTWSPSPTPSFISSLLSQKEIAEKKVIDSKGEGYSRHSLEQEGEANIIVTFYQPYFPSPLKEDQTGGILVFEVDNSQVKKIWESDDIITLTRPVIDVRDVTGDGKTEILAFWSDGKVDILYIYSWNGKSFDYITPIQKVESKYAPENLYAPIFGVYKGNIQIKDLDGDNVEEVIISGGTTRDEVGNEILLQSEIIYKWNGHRYYLWKEEKIGDETPEPIE